MENARFMGWERHSYKVEFRKRKYPKGRDNMRRHARIWDDNMKTDLTEIR